MAGIPQEPKKKNDQELGSEGLYGGDAGLSRSGSPDWGGVDLTLGDNADATQNSPERASRREEDEE
jgi:hypothetical protein